MGWPCVCAKQVLVPTVSGPCFCNRCLAVKICLPNSCCLCGRIPRSYLAQEQIRVNGETLMCARAAAFVHDLFANLSVCRAGRSTRQGERNSEAAVCRYEREQNEIYVCSHQTQQLGHKTETDSRDCLAGGIFRVPKDIGSYS